MGFDYTYPPPLKPLKRAGHHPPTEQAVLAFLDRHQACRSHGVPRPTHIFPFGPCFRIRSPRHRALATPRIIPKVHDEGSRVHAERRRLRLIKH